jgi:hypothetical protein
MERKLIPTTNNLQQGGGRRLTKHQDKLAKTMIVVNNLVRFPLKQEDLEDWALQIDRIYPMLHTDVIIFVLDSFATEKLEWDPNKGIQNIFLGLQRVYWCGNEHKFKVAKAR